MTDTEQSKADATAKQRTDDQKKHAEEAKKKLGEAREAREKASKEREKTAGATKPTPTQEENDLAAMGVQVAEHEDDGSGPDPNVPAPDAHGHTTKQMEAGKPTAKPGYQTKATA
jgi:membrane protein involved in colicin uptake